MVRNLISQYWRIRDWPIRPPAPSRRLDDLLTKKQRSLKPPQLIPIMSSSPKHWRNAVYAMAYYFNREFDYDFVQYAKPGTEVYSEPCEVCDEFVRAFLWTTKISSRELSAVGACCFRQRTSKRGRHWGLQWVWIHPFQRRKGLLTGTWPFFKLLFGNFYPEPPLSENMDAFLRKNDPNIYKRFAKSSLKQRPAHRRGSCS